MTRQSDDSSADTVSALPRIAVSPKEACGLLGVSRGHLDGLIRAGEIDAAKSGARTLVSYSSLVEYFERHKAS